MTTSAIYAGTIRHRRFAERARSFEHGLAMASVDLDELPSLLGGRLAAPRPGLARFRRGARRGGVLQGESEKLLHVSPFFGMDQRYDWRVAEPGTTLSVHIENREHGERAFDATLSLRRRELTPRSLTAATLRYPCATLRILALIYAHTAAIRLRGVRTRPHPARVAR